MPEELDTWLQAGEGEQLEFKLQWSDSALETLAAFANSHGGTLLIGVSDNGQVSGWNGNDKELRAIVDQITDGLRLEPQIQIIMDPRGRVLCISVAAVGLPIALRGRYYQRLGNTTRQLSPETLGRLFIEKSGASWDKQPTDASLGEIDPTAVQRFLRLAHERLPGANENEPLDSVLRKLDLLTDDRLRRGALLLFGRRPQTDFHMAYVHMGRLKTDTIIVDDKFIEGNLFQQLDQVMQYFRQYLQVRLEVNSRVSEGKSMLEAIQRQDIWDYPLDALREAVINALIHRDYFDSTGHISIRVYDDQVYIWNPGELLPGMTIEDLLRRPHDSRPRNPLLARVFYYAGWIEHWGSGVTRILDLCQMQGIPAPQFRSAGGRFEVTFSKSLYRVEPLQGMGLNERQQKAIAYLNKNGQITNKEYQSLTGVSKPTATRDLEAMVAANVLEKHGRTGKGTYYRLKGLINGSKGSKGSYG